MPYPPAPTEFEDVIRLIPFRGTITMHRFMIIDKPFELRVGRNESNIVFLEFCVPVERVAYWSCIRTVESLTTQRAIWSHWQKFLADPDEYLTWKYIGVQAHL